MVRGKSIDDDTERERGEIMIPELSKEEREAFDRWYDGRVPSPYNSDFVHNMLVEVFQLGIQTERNKHRWISVKDRLPDDEEKVLLLHRLILLSLISKLNG